MNSISKSYKPNKKTKSRTITSNKENHNKNINLVNNKKNSNSKLQYPSLKIENKLLLKQNYINRIINNIVVWDVMNPRKIILVIKKKIGLHNPLL